LGAGLKVIGIDLAGKENNPSGFAVLSQRRLQTKLVYSDNEIISSCLRVYPKLIAIDAPLSTPVKGNLRDSDLTLIKRGLRVLPPTLLGMRRLTERGVEITKKLREKGLQIIEIHPRTSGIIIFKTASRKKWVEKLRESGFKLKDVENEHEIDAILAAVTAQLHLHGKTEMVGKKEEGIIVIPLPKSL
jgi:hypothetical protein